MGGKGEVGMQRVRGREAEVERTEKQSVAVRQRHSGKALRAWNEDKYQQECEFFYANQHWNEDQE